MDGILCGFLLTFACITQTTALRLTYPGVTGMVEINERTKSLLNCSELANGAVYWKFWRSAYYWIGSCPYVGSCTSLSDAGYTASRLSVDVSMMTIDPAKNVSWVLNGVIGCEYGSLEVLVTMDVIYPPEVELCSVQANTSTSPWTVYGRCSISKTYSSRNRYSCQWYRKQGSSNETAVGQPIAMTTVPLDNTGHYVAGSCDITLSWPPEALYSYRVVVFPGSVSIVAGNVEIRKPSVSHNCPQYTVEGQNVNCACGGDVGSPPGIVQWNNNGYGQLTLTMLHKSQNGTQFRCQAVWNGVVHEAVYTLIVLTSHVPSITLFTLNAQRGNLTVAENDYVTFSCGATGRPTPDMQIVNSEGVVSSASKGGEISPTDPVQWLNHTVPAQGQHAGTYRCTGSNSAGTGTSENATLFVNLDFPTDKADEKGVDVAVIVGGAVGGVVVLVVIIVVIICCFRKRIIGGDRANNSADNRREKVETRIYTELCSISKHVTSSSQSGAPTLPAPRSPTVTQVTEAYQNMAFELSNEAPTLPAPTISPVTKMPEQYQNMAFVLSKEASDGNSDDQGMYEEPAHNQGVTDTSKTEVSDGNSDDEGLYVEPAHNQSVSDTAATGSTVCSMYIDMSPRHQT